MTIRVDSVRPSDTQKASVDLRYVKAQSPKYDAIVKAIPGVEALLEKAAKLGGVATGPIENPTKVNWNVWTHSEETGKHYGHGLKDKQIAEEDVIFTVQEDPKGPILPLGGYREIRGQIVSVQRLCDMQHQYNGMADGGHWGFMQTQAGGKKGDKVVMSWSIISVKNDGSVRGGGYPPARPANHKDGSGVGSGGGEYGGRKWEVTIGSDTSVPIIDDSH